MNNSASYEKLIAQKIKQLPLPDRVDEIWATIECELDVPETGTTQDVPTWRSMWVKWSLSTLVVAAVLIWLLLHNKQAIQKDEPLPKVMPEKEKGFLVADTNANEVLKNKEDKTIIKSFSDTKDTNQYINTETRTDSVIEILVPSVSSDSVTVEKINNLLPVVDSVLSIPPTNKPKGVKGISNKDYRVESNIKDSTKKKN